MLFIAKKHLKIQLSFLTPDSNEECVLYTG